MSKSVFLYVRVSTLDQATGAESQTRALLDWCEKNQISNYEIFTDQGVSGAKESRPALNQMMERVDRGDASHVIVWSFSRFARSTSHLLKALNQFKEKHTRFISITEMIDTESPLGVALYTILGALAQMEREMIVLRVKAGMKNAKAKGVRIGRKKKRNSSLIRSLIDAKLSYREIARIASCSHGSVHAELVAYRKEKEAAEKAKLDQLTSQIAKGQVEETLEKMKSMNFDDKVVQQVQAKLEGEARDNVKAIQGDAYETYD